MQEVYKGRILYIGGFELPDKNAAAQRVIGIGKGLRELGYEVIFLNSVKKFEDNQVLQKEYFEFKCFEYKRESDYDYLVTAKTCLERVEIIKPDIVIAYNYPGFALDKIRRYCVRKNIKCYADVTEWYRPKVGSIIYRLIKTIDTSYRMRIVQKNLDGIIAISRFLYDYYNRRTKTVMIPPTVDIHDEKWKDTIDNYMSETEDAVKFVYAGSPSAQKERLELIVEAIERLPDERTVLLLILGITEEEFRTIYNYNKKISKRISFFGRVNHGDVINVLKRCDWSIILRDNNFVVRAGFPTKLVEAITCGTPVIINDFSNVTDYLNADNSITLSNPDEIDVGIVTASKVKRKIANSIFDYRNYLGELEQLLFSDY